MKLSEHNKNFKVGDRVRIILTGCEDNECGPHFGMLGVIKNLSGNGYSVERDDRAGQPFIHYDDRCLEPEQCFFPMYKPEFDLEDMELAEIIFHIGDKVTIIAPHPPNVESTKIPPGTEGEVIGMNFDRTHTPIHYRVRFSCWTYDFYPSDLEPADNKGPRLNPEMELEEIEAAEIIMEELK